MDKELPKSGEIFERVASGDREALQEFIATAETTVRRRVASRLRDFGVVCDENAVDDVMQVVRLRLDDALVHRRIKVPERTALWRLIIAVATNVAYEEARRIWRLRDACAAMAREVREHSCAGVPVEDFEAARAILNHLDPDDRDLITLAAKGVQASVIADGAGLSRAALYKRLARLKATVREQLRVRRSGKLGGGPVEARSST